ncbi:hypothetical protein F443_14642 [Phytophthora nicotianae P1569]|uniref:Uncharacterized protein n=1 Tax=Phytophthora nicotianae P1569 TaxID=1317065 RepID=V9EKS0_PHYNI|nr:hypothetical protein F443_14642 [Phytophthora nicotianae P1569]
MLDALASIEPTKVPSMCTHHSRPCWGNEWVSCGRVAGGTMPVRQKSHRIRVKYPSGVQRCAASSPAVQRS